MRKERWWHTSGGPHQWPEPMGSAPSSGQDRRTAMVVDSHVKRQTGRQADRERERERREKERGEREKERERERERQTERSD